MTKLAPEWVRTSDPVIRSPARYRWTTAPAVVLGGVWLEGCVWLMGVDGYGVWVVVESVWLEGYGWSQGCN